jgi:hypothetical protein
LSIIEYYIGLFVALALLVVKLPRSTSTSYICAISACSRQENSSHDFVYE